MFTNCLSFFGLILLIPSSIGTSNLLLVVEKFLYCVEELLEIATPPPLLLQVFLLIDDVDSNLSSSIINWSLNWLVHYVLCSICCLRYAPQEFLSDWLLIHVNNYNCNFLHYSLLCLDICLEFHKKIVLLIRNKFNSF